MKVLVLLLASFFSLAIALPAPGDLASIIRSTALCGSSSGKKCSKESSHTKQQSEKSNDGHPCSPYCSVQNCQCYLLLDHSFTFISLPLRDLKKFSLENEKVFSLYLSDCWQPPEMI